MHSKRIVLRDVGVKKIIIKNKWNILTTNLRVIYNVQRHSFNKKDEKSGFTTALSFLFFKCETKTILVIFERLTLEL